MRIYTSSECPHSTDSHLTGLTRPPPPRLPHRELVEALASDLHKPEFESDLNEISVIEQEVNRTLANLEVSLIKPRSPKPFM